MTHHFSDLPLYFKLLGTPQIFSYGEEINITRKNVRAMAYYLACQQNNVNRANLGNIFWPDQSDTKSASALRETLSKLRGNLPDREMLVTTPALVHFDPEKVQSDVWEFLAISESLEPSLKHLSQTPILPHHIPSQLENAINLWGGASFLDTARLPSTEEFNYWHDTFGRQLKLKQTNFITTLISHLINQSNLTEAFHYMDLLNQDVNEDFNINFHYEQLSSLINNQNFTMAKHYLDYLEPIANDHGFNIEETSLKKIIDTVKNPTTFSITDPEKEWLQNLSYQLSLTGQDEIIQQVEKLRNQYQGVLLTGETGIGKSRIAYELHRRVFNEYNFAYVEAFPAQARESYALLRKLILKLINIEDIYQLPDLQRRKLKPLFPEITTKIRAHRIVLKLSPVEQLKELTEGIAWLLTRVSIHKPLLIVIDDIQHCDYASFRVIHDLIQHNFSHKNGFGILTADQNLLSPGKKEKINDIGSQIKTIRVPTLTVEQADHMISEFLDHSIPLNLTKLLYRETKGNIHLMLSTISNFQASFIDPETINHMVITNAISLPNWYENQRQQLSKDAVELLDYCTIIDTPINYELLEAATQWASVRLNNAFEELEDYQFLAPIEKDSIQSGYRFQHQMLRDRTMEQLTMARQRKIHLAIVDALQKAHPSAMDNVAATIADHCFGAGKIKLAFEYSLMAAQYAIRSYAPEDADQLFKRLETYHRNHPSYFSDTELMLLYSKWAYSNLQFNKTEVAREHGENLLHMGHLRQSNYLMGTGLLYLGLSDNANQLATTDSIQYIDQAIELLNRLPLTLELIHCKVEKAHYFSTHNSPVKAAQLCQEILVINNPDPDREQDYHHLLNRTKFTLAFLYAQSADLKKADALLAEVLGEFRSDLDAITELHYRNLQEWVKFYMGDTLNSVKNLQELLADADTFNNEIIKVELLINLCRIQHYFGNNDAALEISDQALAIAEKYQLHHFSTNVRIVRGFVYQSIGAVEASYQEFELALAAAQKDNHQLSLNAAAIHQAILEGYDGDTEKGFRMAKAVLEATNHTGNRFLFLQSQFFYFSLCVNVDPTHQYNQVGKEDIEFYIKECKEKGLALFQVYGETLIAYLEFNEGTQNQAYQSLYNAIKNSREHNFKLFELSAYHLLALHKSLNPGDKIRVKSLIDEVLKNSRDPRLKNSTQEYCEIVAKKTEIV